MRFKIKSCFLYVLYFILVFVLKVSEIFLQSRLASNFQHQFRKPFFRFSRYYQQPMYVLYLLFYHFNLCYHYGSASFRTLQAPGSPPPCFIMTLTVWYSMQHNSITFFSVKWVEPYCVSGNDIVLSYQHYLLGLLYLSKYPWNPYVVYLFFNSFPFCCCFSLHFK